MNKILTILTLPLLLGSFNSSSASLVQTSGVLDSSIKRKFQNIDTFSVRSECSAIDGSIGATTKLIPFTDNFVKYKWNTEMYNVAIYDHINDQSNDGYVSFEFQENDPEHVYSTKWADNFTYIESKVINKVTHMLQYLSRSVVAIKLPDLVSEYLDYNLVDITIDINTSECATNDYYCYSDGYLYIDTSYYIDNDISTRGFTLFMSAETDLDRFTLSTLMEVMTEEFFSHLEVHYYRDKNATSCNDQVIPENKTVNVTIDSSNFYTADQILTQVRAEDVFGVPCELKITSNNLVNEPGNYTIVATATDSYGNKAYLTINVTVIDYSPSITPIEGASTEITVNYSSHTKASDILSLFKATDYSGNNLNIKFKDGSSFDNKKIGESTYTLVATDSKGRSSELTIKVNVVQDIPPVFLFSDTLLLCSIDNPLNLQQLKEMIVLTTKVEADSVTNITIVNESVVLKSLYRVGSYDIEYIMTFNDGTKKHGSIKANVNDQSSEDKKSFWDKVSKWFSDVGKAIQEFFIKLGHWLSGKGWKL